MATNTYTTAVDNSTDAAFRVWGSALSSAFQACGLVQTADTGQANWATATRSASYTAWELYYLNDALHATAPIYLKIKYGSIGSNPIILIITGSGTDGAGNLTGLVSHASQATSNGWICSVGVPTSTVLTYPTYVCVNQGFFGFAWKSGAVGPGTSKGLGFFALQRTCDADGDPDNYGYVAQYASGTATASQTMNISAATVGPVVTNPEYNCIFPGSLVSGSTQIPGRDIQAMRFQFAYPRVKMGWATLAVANTEFPVGETTTQTPVGTTPRTYISTGWAGYRCANRIDSTHLMLWE